MFIKKHLLLAMLKQLTCLIFFVETQTNILLNKKTSIYKTVVQLHCSEFIWNKYVFTVTFDQFNASLLNKILISLKKKHTDPKLLNENTTY